MPKIRSRLSWNLSERIARLLLTQSYLWNQFEQVCQRTGKDPHQISFGSIKELVPDADTNYSWAESRHINTSSVPTFEALVSAIKKSIENGLPHILSTPKRFPDRIRWHMLTVVAYDGDNVLVYDPDPEKNSPFPTTLHRIRLRTLRTRS